MRYYIKSKLKSDDRRRLADSLRSGSLARNKIFYDGMQTALREGTIDENGTVHFIEVCYCLEGGLYPIAMEIPVLKDYFEDIVEVKDARLRNQCTMECEFCDCTRNIRLPGKPIVNELHIDKEEKKEGKLDEFIDIGRLRLNRKKQKEGIEGLRNTIESGDRISEKLKPIFAGAAISGLFVIFCDVESQGYFRIKNIPDTIEARRLLSTLELKVDNTVSSMKMTARNSLAQNDKRSNVV
ncbi:MAG: hypothetical protein ACRD5B_11095 [Nitrososphaeraceae archaeon]